MLYIWIRVPPYLVIWLQRFHVCLLCIISRELIFSFCDCCWISGNLVIYFVLFLRKMMQFPVFSWIWHPYTKEAHTITQIELNFPKAVDHVKSWVLCIMIIISTLLCKVWKFSSKYLFLAPGKKVKKMMKLSDAVCFLCFLSPHLA